MNPTKISGCCGRLLCCLNYENEHYVESNRLAREQAKAEKVAQEHGCEHCPKAAEAASEAAAPQAAKAFEKEEDNTTEISVETYYDPSLVQYTVDAAKQDNAGKKRSHAPKDTAKDKKNNKSGERSGKLRRPKRTYDVDADEYNNIKHEKSEKPRKPRKRGSRGGRNRNKSHAKPKQSNNNQ